MSQITKLLVEVQIARTHTTLLSLRVFGQKEIEEVARKFFKKYPFMADTTGNEYVSVLQCL